MKLLINLTLSLVYIGGLLACMLAYFDVLIK